MIVSLIADRASNRESSPNGMQIVSVTTDKKIDPRTSKPLPLLPIYAPSFRNFDLVSAALAVPASAALSESSDVSTPNSAAMFMAITKDPSERGCGSYSPGSPSSAFQPRRQQKLGDEIDQSSSYNSTPRASYEMTAESSSAFYPMLSASPERLRNEEIKSGLSRVSSISSMTPTPSAYSSHGTSVRSIVDLPMNVVFDEFSSSGAGFIVQRREGWKHAGPSQLQLSNKQPHNPMTSTSSVGHASRHSPTPSNASRNAGRPRPTMSIDVSRSNSRLGGGIGRIWKSKSLSYASSRSSKGSRVSVYDPELGVRTRLNRYCKI